ncbi:MAG: anaerobic ribonucleoside-triphosphate reductase activating protein [Deltaproteobacteria bacterium]|nr:anaerobic ribonucleoside-triphosphate reductase activating protein [Deltaproteobacteria bacterium]MBW2135953.1 anaerobic ribonucleoside-triphosphate reductase activating protein [Deltaproteobacteria bacterium]
MVLGGLQRNSFIDFPGRVSCVLFLRGCNFHCPYCHNPELVRGTEGTGEGARLAESDVYEFLSERRGFLDGVVISGGEPTLQDELPDLCDRVKGMGFPVKLDTNGSRPHTLKALINGGMVDYIAMDIKTAPSRYSLIAESGVEAGDILKSVELIITSGIAHEFRTTCVSPIVREHDISSIARLIQGAQMYALQRFHADKVLYPDFFRGQGHGYDEGGMLRLKSLAEPWVQKCVVR